MLLSHFRLGPASVQEKLAKTLNVEQNDITISEMQEDWSRDDAKKAASHET